LNMGNIRVQYQSGYGNYSNLLSKAIIDAKSLGFQHLSVKIGTGDYQLIYALETLGFHLVNAQVTYSIHWDKSQVRCFESTYLIRNCTENDLNDIKKFAKNSFKFDRFHADEGLDSKLADEYYEKWIENCYFGYADRVIVVECDGKAVGFSASRLPRSDDSNQMAVHILSAVDFQYRGKGIYSSMIQNDLLWYSTRSKAFSGETQINNIAIQKAYISLGMTFSQSQYVFHLSL
jgi:ribosomal protein S18 acetylase RimI-like enzyme